MAEIGVAVATSTAKLRLSPGRRAPLGRPEAPDRGGRRGPRAGKYLLAPPILDAAFPGGSGRWEIRTSTFRQGGLPHRLLVLADVSRPLREEERQAWRRLIRVLGHELNNSLAPIQSLAESLRGLLATPSPPEDWKDDMRQGLAVIASRSESLSRFTNAYARLARLPQPRFREVEIAPPVRRVAGLDTRLPIRLTPGPEAVLARISSSGRSSISFPTRWTPPSKLGQGRASAGNAPTGIPTWRSGCATKGRASPDRESLRPFFTTKPEGSGIGLVLSRQIAEAHGGSLTLENRQDRPGCVARLTLPRTA
jgi:signal transduction histidine kinase